MKLTGAAILVPPGMKVLQAAPQVILIVRHQKSLLEKDRVSEKDRGRVAGAVARTRNGKAAAVLLVPHDDDDLERLLLGRSPRFQALLDRSRQSIKEGKGLSEKAFWQAVRKRAQERKAAGAAGRRTKRRS
jgi:hypothetical protein